MGTIATAGPCTYLNLPTVTVGQVSPRTRQSELMVTRSRKVVFDHLPAKTINTNKCTKYIADNITINNINNTNKFNKY